MTIKMKSELFDCLKWIVMVVIPAATTAYVGLASIWHWPFADEIAKKDVQPFFGAHDRKKPFL